VQLAVWYLHLDALDVMGIVEREKSFDEAFGDEVDF
jgi:hypothetical protein